MFLDDGYEEVQASALKFIEAGRQALSRQGPAVARRRPHEPGRAFAYNEEQRLRLVVVGRRSRPRHRRPHAVVVSFNQPWAEYIARKDQELTPLHFADTWSAASSAWPASAGNSLRLLARRHAARDAMEVSRQLDRWSQIGVPLIVFLSAPSSMGADSAGPPSGPSAGRSGPRRRDPAWQNELVASLFPCCWPSIRCKRLFGRRGKTTSPTNSLRPAVRHRRPCQARPANAHQPAARFGGVSEQQARSVCVMKFTIVTTRRRVVCGPAHNPPQQP